MDLSAFLNDGLKRMKGTFQRFYLGNATGRRFVRHMAVLLGKAARVRRHHEKNGDHIPPFLICSVASQCNLQCPGCYARANGGCSEAAESDLTAAEWKHVFDDAASIGVTAILIAGGEPLLRRDVIQAAAATSSILFGVFTNGTMVDNKYLDLFDSHRNVVPLFSVEGNADQTDARRGFGVASKVAASMAALRERGILFGASITVTTENMMTVTAPAYAAELRDSGCGLVFYVEYVPAEQGTERLVLSEPEMATLQKRIDALREDQTNAGIHFLSFPGDEDRMGGCLAAGRGFFHINAHGGAEPCPFSPFSTCNLKTHTLLDVLHSPFFAKVRTITAAESLNHKGGCTLFEHEDAVRESLILE